MFQSIVSILIVVGLCWWIAAEFLWKKDGPAVTKQPDSEPEPPPQSKKNKKGGK